MGKSYAISSTGKTEKSTLDLRFGKCKFIFIYEAETNTYSQFENPFKEGSNSGINLVNYLSEKGISTVITGEVGPKTMDALEQKKIQLVLLDEERIKIEEIIDKIRS